MRLDRSEFEEYIALHAQVSRLDERKKELADRIKQALHDGQKSPRDLPYLLKLRESTRTIYDYKHPLLFALRKLLGSTEKAEREVASIEAGFDKKTVESLIVEQNKAYAAKIA